MPFIHSPVINKKHPHFYVLRTIASCSDLNNCIKKMATQMANQGKKVLIFDTLLGLKNFSTNTNSANKISLVFQGKLPLTDIVIHQEKVDIICGSSNQNLSALNKQQQHKIKNDLIVLAQHYDDVIINYPSTNLETTFGDLGTIFWMVTPNNRILLKTLQLASQEKSPQIILTKVKNPEERNNLHFTIKSLLPQAKIIEIFE